jgi:hypothetical protein
MAEFRYIVMARPPGEDHDHAEGYVKGNAND